MTSTPTATGTPPVHPTVYAEALAHVGRLVESGQVPLPQFVATTAGETVVHVAADDLGRWVAALDIPAPDWHTSHDGDWIYRTAVWPDVVNFELLFRLACSDRVPAVFDPLMCGPACWSADLGLG